MIIVKICLSVVLVDRLVACINLIMNIKMQLQMFAYLELHF